MPYQNLTDGLYVIKQFLPEKGVEHFGLLDVGNRLRYSDVWPGSEPVVIHQRPPLLQRQRLSATGQWEMVSRIVDEARVAAAAQTPDYDLFGNNCEHFTQFIETGIRKSPQLAKVVIGAAAVGAVLWLVSQAKS